MMQLQNLIGGKLTDPVSKNYLDNVNPATGSVYSLIPDSDERDVAMAVEAAKNAFPEWSELSKEKRLEYMTDTVMEEYAEYAEEADI